MRAPLPSLPFPPSPPARPPARDQRSEAHGLRIELSRARADGDRAQESLRSLSQELERSREAAARHAGNEQRYRAEAQEM